MNRTWAEIQASGSISDAEMDRFGISLEELTVVRFRDNCEDLRWFKRDVEELGTIRALCADGAPINRHECISAAKRFFGEEACVLWV